MTVEERLRALAGDVRVEVTGDVAATVERRAQGRALRRRAAVATGLATALIAAGAVLAVLARAPEVRRLEPTKPGLTATPRATPSPSPSLSAADAASLLTECRTTLRADTGGRETFRPGASLAAVASDDLGSTVLVLDGAERYRACHRNGGVTAVDGDWSYTDCEGNDAAINPSVGRPLRTAAPVEPGGPSRIYWLLHGCVSGRVARVEVVAKHTTFGAVVGNGLFVGRHDTGLTAAATTTTLSSYEDVGYRAYDAAGTLVSEWPRPAETAALSKQYERCVRARGFDPQGVQVLLGEDAPTGVKTGRDVPAEVHRPCFVEIGGSDPHASSYGN